MSYSLLSKVWNKCKALITNLSIRLLLFHLLNCYNLFSIYFHCHLLFLFRLNEFIQIRQINDHSDCNLTIRLSTWDKHCDHQRKGYSVKEFPIPLHAQEKLFYLVIVAEMTSNFRQEIRYSYYRNDPVKYDLNSTTFCDSAPVSFIHETHLRVCHTKSGLYGYGTTLNYSYHLQLMIRTI